MRLKRVSQILRREYRMVRHNRRVLRLALNKVPPCQRAEIKEYAIRVIKFWRAVAQRTPNIQWHLLYFLRGGIKDVRCIPEEIFFERILPKINDFKFVKAYADKCSYDIHFPVIKQPKTLIKNMNGIFYDGAMNVIQYERVIEILNDADKWLIVKPSVESGNGRGIAFINPKVECKEALPQIIQEARKDFIIQELFLDQSPSISALNPTSLNTIRVMTLLWKGKVYDLSAHIRVGPKESHFDHYGTSRPITRQGLILPQAISCDEERSAMTHDNFGVPLSEVRIPKYEETLRKLKELHLRCPYFSIIGWDIALDAENNPVLIEVNNDYPGVNAHQIFFGPILEEHTDEILDYVFYGKRKKFD